MPYAHSGQASESITVPTDAKVLTANSVSCGARTACDGLGFACNTPATFYVVHWLQVANLSFLKPAPNGVNYIDIRRFFLHARCEFSGMIKYSQHFIVHNFESRPLSGQGDRQARLFC
jgi:hypothetical protein